MRCGITGYQPVGRGRRSISLTQVSLVLWVVYLALSPVYLFESGQAQPVDWIGVIMVGLVGFGLGMRVSRPVGRVLVLLVLAVAWSTAVSIGWYLWTQEAGVLRAPLFYAYNVAILVAMLTVAEKDSKGVLRATEVGLFLGLSIVFAGLAMTDSGSYRNTSFFNNPNQLGYFGILAGGMVGLIAHRLGWQLLRIALFAAAMIAALFSFSLAALGAVIVMIAWASRDVWSRWQRMSGVAVLAILMATGTAFWGEILYGTSLIEGWGQRAGGADSKLEGALKQRGYYRVAEYPQYLMFGAAEGGLHRINPGMQHEMHSTPGTLLFSYGVLGAMLSGAIILLLWKMGSAALLAVFLGPLVYGLFHQGLRFTPLWLLIGLFVVVSGQSGFPWRSRLHDGAATGRRADRDRSWL